MGRKKKCRHIALDLSCICHCFGPLDMGPEERSQVARIIMEADELQALQLKDDEGCTMVEGAKRMGISKSVFGEIYKGAREKLVDMVVNGKVLLIKCPERED